MPATRHRMYVLKPGAFELLAGTDPALRGGKNLHPDEPNLSAISAAAGLNSTTLGQIKRGEIGVSIWVKAALVGFLMDSQGYTKESAEFALFDLLTPDQVAAQEPRAAAKIKTERTRQAVAA